MTIQINDTWLRAIAARYAGEVDLYKHPFRFKFTESVHVEKLYTVAANNHAIVMLDINSEYETLEESKAAKNLRSYLTPPQNDLFRKVDIADIKSWAGECVLPIPCELCGTDGKLPCQICNERGSFYVECDHCAEDTKIMCHACEGKGYTKCACGNKESGFVAGDMFGAPVNKPLLALALHGVDGPAKFFVGDPASLIFIGDGWRVMVMSLRNTISEDHYTKEAV